MGKGEQRRLESARRLGCASGVIQVVMGDDDRTCVTMPRRDICHPLDMLRIPRRAGIDHHHIASVVAADDIRIGARAGHHRGVGREDSDQCAAQRASSYPSSPGISTFIPDSSVETLGRIGVRLR